MNSILLWSASNRIKNLIARTYLGYHYVWCSPIFDASAAARHTPGAAQPPSSDPVSIYRALLNDVMRNDRHSDAISRQKDSCKATALYLSANGGISAEAAAEIATIVESSQISDWKPLIYAIPYHLVEKRVQLVPLQKRAGFDPEYIIPDLRDDEFHIIEPMAC